MYEVSKALNRPEPSLLRGHIKDHAGAMAKIEERIGLCNRTKRSNCIGTALYIAGEIDYDEVVHPTDTYKSHLKKLELAQAFFLGCLVAWQKDLLLPDYGRVIFVAHMGIVTSLNPFLITNRVKANGRFVVDEPAERIFTEYVRWDVNLYIPQILAKANVVL